MYMGYSSGMNLNHSYTALSGWSDSFDGIISQTITPLNNFLMRPEIKKVFVSDNHAKKTSFFFICQEEL